MIRTSEDAAALANRIIGGDDPLENEQVQAVLLKAVSDHMKPEGGFDQGGFLSAVTHVLHPYMRNMLDLAAWVHDQGGGEGLGVQVSLIDSFAAWGEREARDTAMMIDLCLGAALEQLVPFTVPDNLWPASLEIKAEALERLAASGRILRLQPEPGVWRLRLLPPEEGEGSERMEEWGKLGWIRRHITAFRDYHMMSGLEADAIGEESLAPCIAYHTERERLAEALLKLLDEHGGQADAPAKKVPGETDETAA